MPVYPGAPTTPSDFLSAACHFPASAGYSQDRYPPPQGGAEEDLSSSEDNPLTIPRPLRREVHKHRLQDQRCRPWPSPLGNRLGSSSSAKRRTGVTTLQASLHVADWPVAPPRFAPHLSMTHGGLTTRDLGVSPDRTHTGRLPSASRSVTPSQPPCCHGAQAAGRTPRTPVEGAFAGQHLTPLLQVPVEERDDAPPCVDGRGLMKLRAGDLRQDLEDNRDLVRVVIVED
jgi:hypothetical protein